MTKRPLFKLDNRLLLCAEFVRDNSKIADIGTDHAYLPIWLARNGKITHAIAGDLRAEPLKSGDQNIKKYYATDIVETRLSDGLKSIESHEADDIIIAGMGGELITSIIDNAPWLKNPEKHLILQPMTKSEQLREYLCNNGFEIIKERAVISDKKVYSVLLCVYSGQKILYDDIFLYIGKTLDDKSFESKEYANGKIKMLNCKAEGLRISGELKQVDNICNIIDKIKEKINN